MNLETLKYFQYIARYKNITKAAKKFYISQSTLSRHIMALESELSVKLFERKNKKIDLTDAGKVLYHDSELFVKHMETVIHNVQAADRGNKSVLRITSPGKMTNILTKAFSAIKTEFPDVELVVESYDFMEIPSAVLYDLYNVGFTFAYASSSFEELECVPLGSEEFCLAVSSELYPEASKEDIVDIIKTMPMILPSYVEPPFMKLVLHELQTLSGISNLNVKHVNTTDSAMLESSLGLGYCILPVSLSKAKPGRDNLSYIQLNDIAPSATIVMLYKKENASELLNCFTEIVKNTCSENDCTIE